MSEQKNERNIAVELLRVIAMIMILVLHYLFFGGIIAYEGFDSNLKMGTVTKVAWLFEALSFCAVNVYVLISAYYMPDTGFNPRRAIRVYVPTWFYSAVIGIIAICFGSLSACEAGIFRIFTYFFPLVAENYWFVTAYILMICLAPFMNDRLKELDTKSYVQLLTLILTITCFLPTILPVKLATDRAGYEVLWFMVLYLIGKFLRYHEEVLPKFGAKAYAALYFVFSVAIWLQMLLVKYIYETTGSLATWIMRSYQYNTLFCLLSSICLFLAFVKMKTDFSRVKNIIMILSGVSLEVYLIHNHIEMRLPMKTVLGLDRYANSFLFIPQGIVFVVATYAACTVIELCRVKLFRAVGAAFSKNKA